MPFQWHDERFDTYQARLDSPEGRRIVLRRAAEGFLLLLVAINAVFSANLPSDLALTWVGGLAYAVVGYVGLQVVVSAILRQDRLAKGLTAAVWAAVLLGILALALRPFYLGQPVYWWHYTVAGILGVAIVITLIGWVTAAMRGQHRRSHAE